MPDKPNRIPRCRYCGDYPAGHEITACRARLFRKWQRERRLRRRAWARARLVERNYTGRKWR